ncbi:anaphase-promoting complex subunit 1 isoform X2 [Chlorella sorokiniana]|uniref:Anaphase-promoting complex subunit 1 isoform X2 n=1 Tax=Chlorella sorokiniana TaxID=3076 RepID=A0A2P6TMR8_CHLSO|nr:anaphase-promoting complex subunit 1 isoform X2 [Chlorella sorokiniana]|eukprot:PRW45626.1 anaphase-promoting complex subunit 1 isoform X2 [Chlorella sorokiniana]
MAAAACVPVIAPIDAGRRVLEGRGAGTTAAAAAQPPHVLLFAGGASTLEPGAVEEEITIQGNSVAWTAGGVLRKQLTTPAPVLAAAWCHFQNTGPDPILCLLHSGSLGVYTQDGDSHAVPLPGAFTGLWPLPQGVLLTGAPAHGPCILVHPLEAVQEVEMAGGGGAGGGWDEDERVVWSGVEVPYLVTHNARHRRLAVWSISTQPAQGFVAVTPMRWPGAGGAQAPRTPLGTVAGPAGASLLPSPGTILATGAPGGATGLSTPTSRLPGGAGPTGTYKK